MPILPPAAWRWTRYPSSVVSISDRTPGPGQGLVTETAVGPLPPDMLCSGYSTRFAPSWPCYEAREGWDSI